MFPSVKLPIEKFITTEPTFPKKARKTWQNDFTLVGV